MGESSMIVVNVRQGIGLDIEYNDDICHIINDGDDTDKLFAYSGILIKLPFLSIYIGEFDEIGSLTNSNKSTGE
jgi:hypothetical protein